MRLSHVSLAVSDRERSAEFYGRFFGLTGRIHVDDRLLIIEDDAGSMLALCPGEPAAAGLPRENHFGFQADDPQQVRDMRETFREAGVEEAEWQDSHGFVRCSVKDPDGYLVEVFAIAR
jgi:catechol 2,3-dioxygenase-like lactoylglutathione lyase family enzyme